MSNLYEIPPLKWLWCKCPSDPHWFVSLPVELDRAMMMFVCHDDVRGTWTASDLDSDIGPPRRRAADAKKDAQRHFVGLMERLLVPHVEKPALNAAADVRDALRDARATLSQERA